MTIFSGEITVDAARFTEAVKWAAKFASTRAGSPLQGGLRIVTDGWTLGLTAASEGVSASIHLPCVAPGGGAGEAVVSARLLAELAGTFGKGVVRLEGGLNNVAVQHGSWTGSLPTFGEGSLPGAMLLPRPVATVAGADLAAAVKRAALAAHRDPDTMVKFLGLRLDISDDRLTLMAAESRRAAIVTIPAAGQPATALLIASVAEVAADLDGEVQIGMNQHAVSFGNGVRQVVVSRFGQSWDEVIPIMRRIEATQHPRHAIISAAEMRGPLKRAQMMRGKEGPIVVTFDNDVVHLGVPGEQASGEAVPAICSGLAHRVGARVQLLTEALASAPDDTVDIGFDPGQERAPLVLTTPDVPGWRHVLMPMRLS